MPIVNLPDSREKGAVIENQVVRYLEDKGYKILDQNFYIFGGELDIVATEDKCIVFVEVKSIFSKSHIYLTERLSKQKISRLHRTIRHWLLKNKLINERWRLDYIAVQADASGKILDLEHLENVEL